jgi:hypothetical protein
LALTWEPADEDGWERSSIGFAFYHSLVDQDPAVVAPALEAYGRVAASWARLEHHIDALLIQVNKPDHSEALFKEHPTSFGKKIDLLKSWFNKYPPLSEYREDIRDLTSKLKILSKDSSKQFISRNVLLHAIPARYEPETKVIIFHHMEFSKDGNIHSRHIRITLAQLETFASIVQLANTFLGHITQEMFTVEGYAKLQGPRS